MKIFIFYFLEVGKVQGVAIFCLETIEQVKLDCGLFGAKTETYSTVYFD